MKTVGDGAFRREDLYGRSNDMGFSGALSFLRRKYTRDLTGVDVAVTGIPFDSATSNRPGARFGPRGIRAASTEVASLDGFPFNFNPFDHLAVVDYGDVWLDYGFPQNIVEKVEKHADTILKQGTSLLSFGGDHFVSYPLLRSHSKIHGPISLIHFDAHSDTWDDDGARIDHGSMFLRAKNEGLIDTSRSIQLGIRSFSDSDHGFTVLTAPWIQEHGSAQAVSEIRRVVGDHQAYLTFDIDCLDPAFAPGTGTPVAGGLSSSEALAITRALVDFNIIAMDVVEVAPAYDHAEITAIAAATLADDFICQLAIRKNSRYSAPD